MTSPPTGMTAHEAGDTPRAPAAVDSGDARTATFVEHLRTYPSTLLVMGVTLFAVFLPVVLVPYAFSDDYTDLYMATGWGATPQFGKSIIDASAITGRPFSGLLIQWGLSAAGSIDNLRFVRLLAVLSIVVLAVVLHVALVRSHVKPVPAALAALLVCSLPAFQVYSAWAVLYSSPLGAVLAGAASLFAVSALDAPRALARDRLVGAVALLFAGLLIYQPAAMFFWVFFAIALAGVVDDFDRSWRVARMHFGVGVAALVLAYLEIKFTVLVMGSGTTGAGRNHLSHDISGKAGWFFHEPLYLSLNLFDLTPSRLLAVFVALVSAGGILLWLVRHGARPLLYVAIGLVLIPLTYLPNLVVEESWAAYRTQVAISGLIAIYFFFGAAALWISFRDWLRPRVSRGQLVIAERSAIGLSALFVAVAVLIAAKNVTTLFAEPHSTEQGLLRSQVAALPPHVSRLVFVLTDWYGGLSKQVNYDEFGFASSVRQWSVGPAVDLILHEQGRLDPGDPRPKVDIYQSGSTEFPPGEPVIDLRGLASMR
jgi:hypothetical protein